MDKSNLQAMPLLEVFEDIMELCDTENVYRNYPGSEALAAEVVKKTTDGLKELDIYLPDLLAGMRARVIEHNKALEEFEQKMVDQYGEDWRKELGKV